MTDFRENTSSFQHADRKAAKGATRKKFATQMDESLLEELRAHAKREGRQLQAVLEDAVEAYLKDKQGYVMRPEVKAAHDYVLERYHDLFVELAK